MNGNSGDRQFESELRRVLGARARQAPMPPDLLEVGDRSIRDDGGGKTWLAVLRVIVVGAAAALLVMVGAPALLDGVRGPTGAVDLTVEQVASHLGVPPSQVVVTQDGAVALQLRNGASEAHLYLVVPSPTGDGVESQLLGWAEVHPGVLGNGSDLTWYEYASCDATSDLQQPNIVFGASGHGISAGTVSVPASGTSNGRLFLIVLDEGQPAPGEVVYLTVEQANAGVGGIQFESGDACSGEQLAHPLLPMVPR